MELSGEVFVGMDLERKSFRYGEDLVGIRGGTYVYFGQGGVPWVDRGDQLRILKELVCRLVLLCWHSSVLGGLFRWRGRGMELWGMFPSIAVHMLSEHIP